MILKVILKSVEIFEGSYSKKYQDQVPCSFAYKVVCIDDKFTKPTVAFRRENAAYQFIKAILKEYEYCNKIMKKKLTMSEEEEGFQLNNVCWTCKNLIGNDEEKVRDHCHVARKFRDEVH